MSERPSILDLLPSHRALLDRHQRRLVELMAVAVGTGLDPQELAFIIADPQGDYGLACLDAGFEFLVITDDDAAMVIAVDVDGLMTILGSLNPEGVEPVATRPVAAVPILVVDAGDEPAVAVLPISELLPRPCS